MRKTAIFRDNLFLSHDPGYNHIESPERIRTIFKLLDKINSGHANDAAVPVPHHTAGHGHLEVLIGRHHAGNVQIVCDDSEPAMIA